jgi:hypothetical protein
MSHTNEFMSVCQIVLNPSDCHRMEDVLTFLRTSGFTVDEVDTENGVVNCTGEAGMVASLNKAHLFEYIRVEFNYYAR